ncbi:MAG: hypothetical protein WC417_07860 [Candidatus Omnitrophota bacterium]
MKKLAKVFFLVLFLFVISYPLTATIAEVPHLINYQGRLTDAGGTPLNGLYNIIFRIYDAEAAGNLLWQGTYSGTQINKGIFNILLGDVSDAGFNFSNLAFDKPYWLEIKVGTDAPMTPRQRIASVGYAVRAENAEKIKAKDTDMNPGYLSDKTDNSTIQVNASNKLEVKGGLATYIKGNEDNYKMDSGIVSMSTGYSDTYVSFHFAFSSPPIVVMTFKNHKNDEHGSVSASDVTTTGFNASNNRPGVGHDAYWVAIGTI